VNDSDILELIGYTAELWDSYSLPGDSGRLALRKLAWKDLLGDLDKGTVKAALMQLASEGLTYAPPPGVIRRRAVDLAAPAGRVPTVDAAWGEVQRAARAGFDRRVEWSHPAVAEIVETLSWWEICHSEQPATLRAQFRDLYEPLRARHETVRYQPGPVTAALTAASATAELDR
jgi:hypothetical protein